MEKPNIVILVVDALRPKNLSLFGYAKETDKNIKKLAKESILFTNHISTSNSTAPSLTSLFTGNYPSTHGIIHQFPYTKKEEIDKLKQQKFWFPSFLRNQGYDTIAIDWIGLWFKKGFNYYEEKDEKPKPFLNNPLIKKIMLNLPNWAYKLGKKITKKRASASFPPVKESIKLAIDKINESEKPFFLFMHLWDTHFPFPTVENPKKTKEKNIQKILDTIKQDSQKEYVKKRITDIGLENVEEIIDKYDRSLKSVDEGVGRLIEFLKDNNRWKNTLFVLLGDHGDSLNEHKIYFSHSGLYQESIHVPLIMKFPDKSNGKLKVLVQNIDIVPTIMDYLGNKRNFKDGKSFLPVISGEKKKIRDVALSYDGLSEDIKSVIKGDKKLIIAKDAKCHLCKAKHHGENEEYDLKKDIKESKNLYSGKSELEKEIDKKIYKK